VDHFLVIESPNKFAPLRIWPVSGQKGRAQMDRPDASGSSGHPDTFPTLEMRPYPLPRIRFTTPFVHGFPVRVGRPSAFNASQTC
jgi:hypothetical protein